MTTKKEGSEAFQIFNSKDLKMQSVCACVCVFPCALTHAHENVSFCGEISVCLCRGQSVM